MTSSELSQPSRHSFEDYFSDWPLKVEHAPDRGRFLVAKRDIGKGEVVLTSQPYLTCILPSHKKRVCAYCLKDGLQRLSLYCSACSIAHYCTPECRRLHLHAHNTDTCTITATTEGTAHTQGPACKPESTAHTHGHPSCQQPESPPLLTGGTLPPSASAPHSTPQRVKHAAPTVPHALLCPTLRRFASFKFDGDMAAILCMCLETLAVQHLQQQQQQQQQQEQAAHQKQPAQRESCRYLGHDDFMLLASSAVVSPQDKADWLKGARFLIAAMQKSGWPGRLPSEPEILDMSLKILSNNFGMWAVKHRGAAPTTQISFRAEHTDDRSSSRMARKSAFRGECTDDGSSSSSSGSGGSVGIRTATKTGPIWQRSTDGCSSSGMARKSALRGERTDDGSSSSSGGSSDGSGSIITATKTGPTWQGTDDRSSSRTATKSAFKGGWADDGSSRTATKATTKEELTGRQVYITASYFNHSCVPNCGMDHSGHVAVVKALQDIPAGTEACISYVDLDLPVFARRAELQRFFNFICSCKRCLEEFQQGPTKVSWSKPQGTEGSRATQKVKGKKGKQRTQ